MGIGNYRPHVKQFRGSLLKPEDAPGIVIYEVVSTGKWWFIKLYV
jgi:hypothetical protein